MGVVFLLSEGSWWAPAWQHTGACPLEDQGQSTWMQAVPALYIGCGERPETTQVPETAALPTPC